MAKIIDFLDDFLFVVNRQVLILTGRPQIRGPTSQAYQPLFEAGNDQNIPHTPAYPEVLLYTLLQGLPLESQTPIQP